MSVEPPSEQEKDKQKILEKYAPDIDKIDLDLSGTGPAQPNVSPDVMAKEKAEEEKAAVEFAREQAPNVELEDFDFLHDQESEDERIFRTQFRQVVLAGYMEGKSLDEIYTAVEAIERSDAVDTKNLPLRDLAGRIYRSAKERGSEVQRCYICGKYNPRYEDSCPSFCPYSESEGQS
ncbi:hypothetical protein [Gloeobacter kilaueensis]|uniref:Uncharacterized protein n=1 Tax=Gloeobacter kilaueensis (strain ATCC BAA-2537 / CCAP 1431/1 / ULC 316 / JS1) TaxID=1183438 RepID=U5QL30_GLOK1|nr:hypothetical protein [Gloeobacter kilaueensis]AGY58360.1 hypothetical protein GKIL_2114 [Gloeobacter kilaueensis JS1]